MDAVKAEIQAKVAAFNRQQTVQAIREDIARLASRADTYFQLFVQDLARKGEHHFDEEAQAQT